MSIEFQYHPDLKILCAKGGSEVFPDDFLGYSERVLAIEDDLTGTIEYIDLGGVKQIHITFDLAYEMAGPYTDRMARGIEASVIYAPTEFSYGLARMISRVVSGREGASERRPIVTRTPVPLTDLREWLGKGSYESGD